MTNQSISKWLAEHISRLSYEDIPKEVVHETKRRFLDFIGNTLASSRLKVEAKIAIKLVRILGGKPECTVIGFGDKTCATTAALANGLISHSSELGDWSRFSNTNNEEAVYSGPLAVAEKEEADGKTLITALVAAYEGINRVGNAGHPGIRNRGFHANGCAATFGAAAGVSKVLGLDELKTNWALGIAGAQSAGIIAFLKEGAMTKRLHTGKANEAGVIAGYLAREGFVGPTSILEDERGGFLKAFVDPPAKPELVVANWAKPYEIMRTNIKLDACCGFFPSGLDTIKDLVKKGKLTEKNVEKITLQSYTMSIDGHEAVRPTTPTGATMSYPYCIALAIMTGRVSIRDVTDERIKDEKFMQRIVNIGKKVDLVIRKDFDKLMPDIYRTITEVKVNTGEVYKNQVDVPIGYYPENPVSDAEMEEKYYDVSSIAIDKNKAKEIKSVVDRLEHIKNVREVTELLVAQK